MDWKNHIVANDGVLIGKPTIKGTRLSIEFIIDRLASGWTEEELLKNYPRLTKESLQAVFMYIKECIKDGLIMSYPLKTA